MAISDVL